MAKRTRRPARPPVRTASPTSPTGDAAPPTAPRISDAATTPFMPPPPRPRPRFWEDHQVAWTKVVIVRLVFFGLMAVDAFRQLAHAARYGAGGFNVPQVAWLPLPAPHRLAMIAVYGGLALAFALIAQGVAVRGLLPLATALYAYAYVASQLDSYQHHYLMCLVLLLWCFVPRTPTPAPAGARPGAPRTVRSWALRLILVQLGVLYLWAAIAKLDPRWFDGSALRSQVAPGWVRNLIGDVGFDRVAVIVLTAELALAATIWLRRLWWLALPLGVGLHLGIELVGLEIGLFSYLMLALYLLVVPDGVYHAIDRATRGPIARLTAAWRPWLIGGLVAVIAAVVGFVGVPLPLTIPLIAAIAIVLVVMADAWVDGDRGRAGRALTALAIAVAAPVVLTHATDTVLDHHRYRAGAARRLGDDRGARAGYQGMLAIEPSSEYAHYYLGGLEAAAGKLDLALAHYHRAQRSAPLVARSFVAEARLVAAKGDLAGAQALARDALAADPTDADALELDRSLSTMTPAEAPTVPAPKPTEPGPAERPFEPAPAPTMLVPVAPGSVPTPPPPSP